MAARLRPAETEREWWALLKSKDASYIRSLKDWKAALANPRRNPLKGCDASAIREFTRNLKFARGGLAHANYRAVERQLSYRQFRDLWATFGLSMKLFEDHKDYACTKKGNCSASNTDICTSNC